MDKKEVSILIPSRFNNRWVLDLNLRTIRKYTRYPYRIIIGDAGIDQEAIDFLKQQKDVRIEKCPDPLRPKNHLARIVETPYFIFLHDDVQILKEGWLSRRVDIMEKDGHIGILGEIGNNFVSGWRWKQFLPISPVYKRFFPLAMLVRKETQDELDFFWGRIKGFDNGGIAYLQFIRQKKWRFVEYKFKRDIRHWGGMTWIMRKKLLGEKAYIDVDSFVDEREKKVEAIKAIIQSGNY